MSQPVLFIDLHGVLVQTPMIFDEYRRITVEHLVHDFGMEQTQAENRYDRAMGKWEKVAFEYLKDPKTEKTGKKFLTFLERCDHIFPTLLYEGMDTNVSGIELRTRPFEYAVASKVEINLYPEVTCTLENLDKHGYEMYIASSSHSSHIIGIMEANNISRFFSDVYGFDTVAATKHTLRYYKQLITRVNADPSSCIMIGNSMQEVLKPRKIGMKTIHINRERNVPNSVKKLADVSIPSLEPLPTCLDKL